MTYKHQMTIDQEARTITVTRVFDAPRDLVFRVYNDPGLIPQWWGPRKYETIVDRLDFRPGGEWRFINRDAEGNEYAFHGQYLEIIPPERFTWTFVYEGTPESQQTETMLFEDLGGKTRITGTSQFSSLEGLLGMVSTGMEEGMAETYDRLDEVVQAQKVRHS